MVVAAMATVISATPALGIGPPAAGLEGRALLAGPLSEWDESGDTVMVLVRLMPPGDTARASVFTGVRSAGGRLKTDGEGGGI